METSGTCKKIIDGVTISKQNDCYVHSPNPGSPHQKALLLNLGPSDVGKSGRPLVIWGQLGPKKKNKNREQSIHVKLVDSPQFP
jgi:hypothetical protein